jgi:hypothetical protein
MAAFAAAPLLDPERFCGDLDAVVEQDLSTGGW